MILLRQFFFVAFIMNSYTSFCQLTFDKKAVEEVFEDERSKGNTVTDTVKRFGILKSPHIDIRTLEQTKVYIFKQAEDDFDPQLHIWYHFDLENSQIKGIRYHWGLYNPSFNPSKEKSRLEKLAKREREFADKYESLQAEITDKLGEPIKHYTIADNRESLIRNIFWADGEKIVGLALKFDRKLRDLPGIGVLGDYKIEVMVTFK